MKKITAVIIDDEAQAISALKDEISQHLEMIEIVGWAEEIDQSVLLITDKKPDIIFLDIQLKGGLSFTILNKIPNYYYHVIFTTAYNDYAIKAIKYSAIDYLLKPIDRFDLIQSVERIKKENFKLHNRVKQINTLNNNLSSEKPDSIILKTHNDLKVIVLDDILLCKANGNYVEIYFINESKILISKTLKSIEEQIDSDEFIRVHQTYLVNAKYIIGFNKLNKKIELNSSYHEDVPVSQRKISKVKSFIEKYIS